MESANGQLYTWGRGFGGCSDCHQPQVLPSLLRFSQIALGWNHALLVSGKLIFVGPLLLYFSIFSFKILVYSLSYHNLPQMVKCMCLVGCLLLLSKQVERSIVLISQFMVSYLFSL